MSETCLFNLHYLNTSDFTQGESFSNICYARQQAFIFTHENPFLTLGMLINPALLTDRGKEGRNATCELRLSEQSTC